MLTGRDAAHKRIKDMLDRGEELPVAWSADTVPAGLEVDGETLRLEQIRQGMMP